MQKKTRVNYYEKLPVGSTIIMMVTPRTKKYQESRRDACLRADEALSDLLSFPLASETSERATEDLSCQRTVVEVANPEELCEQKNNVSFTSGLSSSLTSDLTSALISKTRQSTLSLQIGRKSEAMNHLDSRAQA